jgi:hypothetical protein
MPRWRFGLMRTLAMAKLKLDLKNINKTLSSRMEILGLVVAGVLVVVCLVWGISTLAGASSPEELILKDAAKIQQARNSGPKRPPAAAGKERPLAWPAVPLNDPNFDLYQFFVSGSAGSNLRTIPRILSADAKPQIDYLHTGIHTVQFASAPEHLQGFLAPGADKDKPHPLVLAAGKRLVVVSATFPYHEQVEEYRKALRLEKVPDVFTKGLAPAIEGLNVDRRKITFKDGQDVEGEWEHIYQFDPYSGEGKVDDRIEKLLRSALYDYRWVEKYYDAIYGSSATPLPLLIHDADYPPILLPLIANRPPPAVPKPNAKAPGLGKQQAFYLPFGKERTDLLPPPADKNHETKPYKFDEFTPDLQDQVSGKINWFSPYGNIPEDWTKLPSRDIVPKFNINNPNAPPPDKNDNYKAPKDLPTGPIALLRFLDVDLEPGTYQYRLQVRMANPNYDRPPELLAHSGVGRDKELVSGWVETPYVTIPYDDFLYYITNQDRGFVSKVPNSRDSQRIDADLRGVATIDKSGDRTVPFQVHHFIDSLKVPEKGGGSTEHYVADWSVGERLLVARGEPIGRKCQVEMVVWKQLRSSWEIHDVHFGSNFNSQKQPVPRSSGLPVDFRADPPVVLLDFTGGRQIYKPQKAPGQTVTIDEDSSTEALLLMPDMTMTLRNGREDVSDAPGAGFRAQERRQRYENWKKWIEDLITPPPPPAPQKKGR